MGTQGRDRWWIVLVSAGLAFTLILLWSYLGAALGGDLAAQYAWTGFARGNPDSAYDFAWYGGMHPASYSPLSPYVMALFGVRTTTVICGAVSAGLVAHLLSDREVVNRPWWPAVYASLALTANAVSGRTTFSLGTMFGLSAITLVVGSKATGTARFARGAGGLLLAAVATAASPVAGLFVGITAGALWLSGRRSQAYLLGVPPVVLVVASNWLFPFSGRQPMTLASGIPPLVLAAACVLLAPRDWRTLRAGAALYAGAVVAAYAVPSPIGSNIVRLGLVFGGIPLVVLASNRAHVRLAVPPLLRRPVLRTGVLASTIVLSCAWQVGVATSDAIATRPEGQQAWAVGPLVSQLKAHGAALGRTEAVPRKNHQEAAVLAAYVNLARGWNRQADAARNPLFYDDEPLTANAYRQWLDTWAVRFVVLSNDRPDPAAQQEWDLVRDGLPYLHHVWSDEHWTLYQVSDPTPLAEAPALVERFTASEVTVRTPRAGSFLIRIRYSPWLRIVDPDDSVPTNALLADLAHGCLSKQEPTGAADGSGHWLVLHAPRAGSYRIAAPYSLPRGSACVD